MTLLLKLVVPTGYMIANDHGRIAVTVCSGVAPVPVATDMPAMHGAMTDHGKAQDHGKSGNHGRAEMPCAFAGLSAALLEPIGTFQLAAPIAFGVVLGLAAAMPPAPPRPAFLRPPLRAPPVYR